MAKQAAKAAAERYARKHGQDERESYPSALKDFLAGVAWQRRQAKKAKPRKQP